MDGITLKVTWNELLLMTEENLEFLGMLKATLDLENIWLKGIDINQR
jgi:hypothetical protein